MIIEPGTVLFVDSFGVMRQGQVTRQIDDNHIEFTLAGYPDVLYTARINDIRLSVKDTNIYRVKTEYW